ncbi:DNA repair protein RadA [Massilia kyonggiensis]|nr:DNA repair protein RadA [Massilia kyonggiensis]
MTAGEKSTFDVWQKQISYWWNRHLGVTPSESEVRHLLSAVRVLTFPDAERFESEEAAILAEIIHSAEPEAVAQALNSLVVHFGTMAKLRYSADAKRLREVLRQTGHHLKDSPQYAKDIQRLKAVTQQTLTTLQRHSEILAPDCSKPIHIRRRCVSDIVSCAAQESFLLIGAPGAGKSGAVHQVAKQMIDDGHPVLLLAVDEWLAQTKEGFRAELGISNALEDVLAAWDSEKNGVLIIDALDASRGSRSDKTFQELILNVQRELKNWTVVASIRKFDLKYGAHYRESFRGQPVASGFCDHDFSGVRHFDIPLLTPTELEQVWHSSALLGEAYSNSTDAFQILIGSPFNLFLLASVADHASKSLVGVTTQVQLLNEYWSYRIELPNDGQRLMRERLLGKVATHMVATRQLFLTSQQIEQLDAEVLEVILRSGVLLAHGVLGKRISFAHHMLFDYAVARSILMIDDVQADPVKLSLSDDDALMLAPAAMIALRMVWAGSQNKITYWDLALSLARSQAEGTFAKMLPARVAAELISAPSDIAPLLEEIRPSAKQREDGAFLIRHMYGTLFAGVVQVRPALGNDNDPWCEITRQLARKNIELLSYPIRVACTQWTEKAGQLTAQQSSALNEASRLLLEASLKRWGSKGVDDGDAVYGIRGTARTFVSAPVESHSVLIEVLEPNRVAACGYSDLFSLSCEIKALIGPAPTLVQELYRTSFCTRLPSSDEVSYLGDSRILSLRTNKRQELESVQYQLSEAYRLLLISHPEIGASTLISIFDYIIPKNHNIGIKRDSFKFDFAGKVAEITEDHSYIWWQPDDRHRKAIEGMLDTFSEGIVELCDADNFAAIEAVLDKVVEENRWAAIWAAIAAAAAERPLALGVRILPLLLNEQILVTTSMTYHLGEVIKQVTKNLTGEFIVQIECAIWRIDVDDEHIRDVLLNCFDRDKLSLPSSRQWLSEREETASDLDNTPPFRIHTYAGDDTEFWHRQNGIKPDDEPTASVLAAIKQVQFTEQGSSSTRLEDALGKWKDVLQLHDLIRDPNVIPSPVSETAWDCLAEAAEKVALLCNSEKDLQRFPRLLDLCVTALDARFSPQPIHDMEREEQFAKSPSWGRPAPRIEAAAALMAYGRALSQPMTEDMRRRTLELVKDPAVAVRHTIAARVNMLSIADLELAGEIVNTVIQSEQNRGVLSFFFGALHNMLGSVHGLVSQPLLDLEKTHIDDATEETGNFSSNLITLIVRLWLDFDNEAAFARISEWTSHPSRYVNRLTAMLHFIRSAFIMGDPDVPSSRDHTTRVRTIAILESLVTNSVAKFNELSALKDRNEAQQRELERVYRLLDTATHAIYFASDANGKRNSTDGNASLNSKVAERLLQELRKVLYLLAEVPYPAITHYLLETLEGLVEHDPESCLQLILHTMDRGGPRGGYQFETLGEDLLVRLVRLYLADYRSLFSQNSHYRLGLVKALDLFAAVGFADARQLVYELPEMLR